MLCSNSLPSLLEMLESLLGLDKLDTCCVGAEYEGTGAPVGELYKIITPTESLVHIRISRYLSSYSTWKACIL